MRELITRQLPLALLDPKRHSQPAFFLEREMVASGIRLIESK
jgi:hypothetical protein